jgi:hypothetical protein
MNNQREAEEYLLKNQLNSTQIDMFQFEPMKMSK